MFLFSIGLVTGMQERRFKNMRLALSAHLQGVMNGTFPELRWVPSGATSRSDPVERAARSAVLFATCGNWLMTTLGTAMGTDAAIPLCRRGITASHGQEKVAGPASAIGYSILIAVVLHSGVSSDRHPSTRRGRRRMMRLLVAVTGATGAAFGTRLLEFFGPLGLETHRILNDWAPATIELETQHSVEDVRSLASYAYSSRDLAAGTSSDSFGTDGIIICPCSIKTLSAIWAGYGDDLITRAADVTLEEQHRRLLVAREARISEIHLENMPHLARASEGNHCLVTIVERATMCATHASIWTQIGLAQIVQPSQFIVLSALVPSA